MARAVGRFRGGTPVVPVQAMAARLIKLAVSLLVAATDRMLEALFVSGRRRVAIYYHGVPVAKRQQFARQMGTLVELARPVPLSGCGDSVGEAPEVVVTFDDGFESVVRHALPELRRRRIPCAMFVPSGCLGRHPAWLPSSHPDATETVLSASDMAALAREALVEFGSHSVTHPNFTSMAEVDARLELGESKTALERILQRPVLAFSFPHGAWDRRAVSWALQAGYTQVFTIDPSVMATGSSGPMIGRVRIDLDDWPVEFELKVRGAYRWLAVVAAVKRQIARVLRMTRSRSLSQGAPAIPTR